MTAYHESSQLRNNASVIKQHTETGQVPHIHKYHICPSTTYTQVLKYHIYTSTTYTQVPHIPKYWSTTYTQVPHIPKYHIYPSTEVPHIHKYHIYPSTEVPHIHKYHIYPSTTYTQAPHIPKYHIYPSTTYTQVPHIPKYHIYPSTTYTQVPRIPKYHIYPSTTYTQVPRIPAGMKWAQWVMGEGGGSNQCPNGRTPLYLHSLYTSGHFHLCLPLHTLPIHSHDLVPRCQGGILGRRSVVKDLDDVEAGTVWSSPSYADANEVLWVLY